jgi:threonine aldolase
VSATGVIDLRTDATSRPTDEMWDAMRSADLGWAHRREDRAVNELEERGANLLGKDAAVLVPTCTMANLVALMTQAERGSQIVLEATAHIGGSEEWGYAYVCGVAAALVPGHHGCPAPADVERAITSSGRPRTSVVCLENSHNNAGGVALTPAQTRGVAAVARRHGAAVHLDGARLLNSAVALGVPATALVDAVDTVSLSLGKGLCAPMGALLAGPTAVIEGARVNLRRIGAGSLHKSGMLGAAGLVALETMVDRLGDDHRRARALATGIAALGRVGIDLTTVQTNIVLIDAAPAGFTGEAFAARLAEHGVLGLPRPPHHVRLVTHRLVGDEEVAGVVAAVAAILK